MGGLGLNLIVMALQRGAKTSQTSQETSQDTEDKSFFRGFSVSVELLIFVQAALGLTVSMVLMHLDSVIKGIGAVAMIPVVTICSWAFLDEEIDAGFSLAVALAVCFTHLYMGEHNNVLKKHDEFKAEEKKPTEQDA